MQALHQLQSQKLKGPRYPQGHDDLNCAHACILSMSHDVAGLPDAQRCALHHSADIHFLRERLDRLLLPKAAGWQCCFCPEWRHQAPS